MSVIPLRRRDDVICTMASRSPVGDANLHVLSHGLHYQAASSRASASRRQVVKLEDQTRKMPRTRHCATIMGFELP